MTPTLEATQTSAETYEVSVRPDNGIPVTLYVVPWDERWYVKRSPDPESLGYITRHTSFETAAKAATGRAKRYLASYARTAKRRAVAA
jgi:hypothetical protein